VIITPAIQGAAAVITLLVFLSIGIIVFSQVMSQAQTVAQNINDTQAVNFIQEAKNMGYTALNLLVIAAFVMAAVVILAIIMHMGMGGGGQ
jgi:ABC-type Fe3+ transport system permease subunit